MIVVLSFWTDSKQVTLNLFSFHIGDLNVQIPFDQILRFYTRNNSLHLKIIKGSILLIHNLHIVLFYHLLARNIGTLLLIALRLVSIILIGGVLIFGAVLLVGQNNFLDLLHGELLDIGCFWIIMSVYHRYWYADAEILWNLRDRTLSPESLPA